MKGYKGTDKNMACRGFQYEVGKTYRTDEPISLCKSGFHFCRNLKDCMDFYARNGSNRFFEIEASGEVIEGDYKCVSSEITFIRELNEWEINRSGYGDGNGNGYGNGYGYGNIQRILIFN